MAASRPHKSTSPRNIPAGSSTSPSRKAAKSRPDRSLAACRRRNTKRSCGRRNPIWSRARQSLAEAESLIDQRKAVLAAAKSDFERGQQLVGKQIITQQTFDQRRRNYEGAEASVEGAIAQREQADAAIKSAQAEVERIESILHDLILVSPQNGTRAIPACAQRRSGRRGRKGLHHPRPARRLHDHLSAGGDRRQTRNRRRGPHHSRSGSRNMSFPPR